MTMNKRLYGNNWELTTEKWSDILGSEDSLFDIQ